MCGLSVRGWLGGVMGWCWLGLSHWSGLSAVSVPVLFAGQVARTPERWRALWWAFVVVSGG